MNFKVGDYVYVSEAMSFEWPANPHSIYKIRELPLNGEVGFYLDGDDLVAGRRSFIKTRLTPLGRPITKLEKAIYGVK